MVPIQIISGAGNGLTACIDRGTSNDNHGLIVATRPLVEYFFTCSEFVDDVYGQDMNIAQSYGASPELVNDGNDSTLWTLNNITGTRASYSTNRSYAGASSLRWDDPLLFDEIELNKGSDLDLTGYVAITFWLNINNGLGVGDNIEIYGYLDGAEVGTRIDLDNYCSPSGNDVWQFVTIPLSDMGLTNQTIDAIRMQLVARNRAPDIYIDVMQIEQIGEDIGNFKIEPATQTNFYLQRIRLFMVDALDTTLASNSMNNLSYDQLLGESQLIGGISLQCYSQGSVVKSYILKDIADFMSKTGAEIVNVACDGTNTYLSMDINFAHPYKFESSKQEYINIRIIDDLSGLIKFTAQAYGYYESTAPED
jgi:hypothetical protein